MTEVTTDANSLDQESRLLAVRQWADWLGSVVSLERLRGCLGLTGRKPLTVDLYLMSELFSGSEAYGLIIAQNLHEIGCRVRVRVPENAVYGGDKIAVNDWLKRKAVPLASRAPYTPGGLWMTFDDRSKQDSLHRLKSFIDADRPDLILASGYIPHLAFVQERPTFVMAVFSAAAYSQTELLKMHGRVDGLISDSAWALAPTAKVVRAPYAVVRSLGIGGKERNRVLGARRRCEQPARPIRIAVTGTLQIRKGQREAVRAIALVLEQGYDVELHFYGYELKVLRFYIDEIDSEIRALGLIDRVKRHGFVESEDEITRDNDIILSASVDESLPQGLLFQMYQGLVGVAVLSGGIDEILIDGEAGYLTDDPTPIGIASALRRALDDRARWAEVIERARAIILDECAAPRTTRRLLDLCRESVMLRAPQPFVASEALLDLSLESVTLRAPQPFVASKAIRVKLHGMKAFLDRCRMNVYITRQEGGWRLVAYRATRKSFRVLANLLGRLRIGQPTSSRSSLPHGGGAPK
jgi:glycosyltransferase involved in cell wall biosynthesis